jgi:hypothetical protein
MGRSKAISGKAYIYGAIALIALLIVGLIALQGSDRVFGGGPGDLLDEEGALEYYMASGTEVIEVGTETYSPDVTSVMPTKNDLGATLNYNRIWYDAVFWVDSDDRTQAIDLLEEISGRRGKSVFVFSGWLADLPQTQGIKRLLTLSTSRTVLSNDVPYNGEDLGKFVQTPSSLERQSTFKDYLMIRLTILESPCQGWLCPGTDYGVVATVSPALIVKPNYCDVNQPERGGDYCFTEYDRFYCDQASNTCKDPCAQCSPNTQECLVDFINSYEQLNQLMSYQQGLCIQENAICDYTVDCRAWVESNYEIDLNSAKSVQSQAIVESQADLDLFRYGAHCEKEKPSDSRVAYINSVQGLGYLGTCEPKAEQYEDCDSIFGDPSKYSFISDDGSFGRPQGWGVTSDGRCVLDECASRGDCITTEFPDVNEWDCQLKILEDTETLSGRVGVCKHTRVSESQCESNLDCATFCGPNYNPECTSMTTAQGEIGLCGCLAKPKTIDNCVIQQTYDTGNEYCMWTQGARGLPLCKKYECTGTIVTASCSIVDATCQQDSDCEVGTYKFGRCVQGCCDYSGAPPLPPEKELDCDNGLDDDGDGLIDYDDPDCIGPIPVPRGDEPWMFPLLIALFMAALIGALAYPRITGSTKRKLGGTILAMVAVGATTYFVVDAMDIQVANPLELVGPRFTTCNDPNPFTGWWNNTWCELGNALQGLKFLISITAAGLFAWFAWTKYLSKLEMDIPLKLVLMSILGITAFLLVNAIFEFVFVIGIVLAIFWKRAPILSGARRVGGALTSGGGNGGNWGSLKGKRLNKE